MAEKKKSTKKAAPKKKAKKSYKAEAGVIWVNTGQGEPAVFTVEPSIDAGDVCDECFQPRVGAWRRQAKNSFHQTFCYDFIELVLPVLKGTAGLYKVKLNPEIVQEILPKGKKK